MHLNGSVSKVLQVVSRKKHWDKLSEEEVESRCPVTIVFRKARIPERNIQNKCPVHGSDENVCSGGDCPCKLSPFRGILGRKHTKPRDELSEEKVANCTKKKLQLVTIISTNGKKCPSKYCPIRSISQNPTVLFHPLHSFC